MNQLLILITLLLALILQAFSPLPVMKKDGTDLAMEIQTDGEMPSSTLAEAETRTSSPMASRTPDPTAKPTVMPTADPTAMPTPTEQTPEYVIIDSSGENTLPEMPIS